MSHLKLKQRIENKKKLQENKILLNSWRNPVFCIFLRGFYTYYLQSVWIKSIWSCEAETPKWSSSSSDLNNVRNDWMLPLWLRRLTTTPLRAWHAIMNYFEKLNRSICFLGFLPFYIRCRFISAWAIWVPIAPRKGVDEMVNPDVWHHSKQLLFQCC